MEGNLLNIDAIMEIVLMTLCLCVGVVEFLAHNHLGRRYLVPLEPTHYHLLCHNGSMHPN